MTGFFDGILWSSWFDALNFITQRQYIRVGATIRGFYREDEPEYPYEALREAVVNAIAHRDYSRIGETVRVFMYADRVEVRSPGGLLPSITLAELVAMWVQSLPRNPGLAGFLRDMPGYMERIGSGIRFMTQEMRRMELPDPEFSEHQDFVVTFRNGVRLEDQPGLTERQRIGLRIVGEQGSISTSEYCDATGAPERTGLRGLQGLVAKGLLVVRGKKGKVAQDAGMDDIAQIAYVRSFELRWRPKSDADEDDDDLAALLSGSPSDTPASERFAADRRFAAGRVHRVGPA